MQTGARYDDILGNGMTPPLLSWDGPRERCRFVAAFVCGGSPHPPNKLHAPVYYKLARLLIVRR